MSSPVFTPGTYRLREAWYASKPDRRLAGPGWRSPGGLPKGAVIVIVPWYVRGEYLSLEVPAHLYAHESLVLHPTDDGWTTIEGVDNAKARVKARADLERLAGLLVPADDHEAWVLVEADRRGFSSRHDELLVQLLATGVITRAQVAAAMDVVDARSEARHAPCTGRACE